MATDAKKRMLKEGALIVHRKGFNATGVAEIVGIRSLPLGSLRFACIERLLNGHSALFALAVALVVPFLDVFGLD